LGDAASAGVCLTNEPPQTNVDERADFVDIGVRLQAVIHLAKRSRRREFEGQLVQRHRNQSRSGVDDRLDQIRLHDPKRDVVAQAKRLPMK
jgi:hypothetical protein